MAIPKENAAVARMAGYGHAVPKGTHVESGNTQNIPLAPIPGPSGDDEIASLTLNSSVQASLVPDEQQGLPAPYKYGVQKSYSLALEAHADIAIADFSSGAACANDAQKAGPFLTIMADDKPLVTSDSVKFGSVAVKNTSDITAPLDAGKYKVMVSFYSNKPCSSVGVNFSIAGAQSHAAGSADNSTSGSSSTSPVLSEEPDQDLLGGAWRYLQNYAVEYSMSWSSSLQNMRATAFGGAVYYDADIKTEFDAIATPKKMRITVKKMNAVDDSISLKVGDQRLCIYQVHDYDMTLECSDDNATDFPTGFTAKAMAFHQD